MQLWQLLQENTLLALTLFGLLGLCVGSFLNVVIHRMPLAMMLEWRAGSVQILSDQDDISHSLVEPIAKIVAKDLPLSLAYPASQCPRCAHGIRWYENIPVLSWALLKGECSQCKNSIGIRYPLVEITTAVLTVLVIAQFGVTLPALSALVLVWALIALTGIDWDTHLLPDRLTVPLGALGLVVNTQGWFVTANESIWGLILGFLSLWVVVKVFYWITKKNGMGQGDFKLLAVLGAWLGPMMLPLIILLSSLLGSLVGIVLMRKHGESKPFAFGPFIAVAGIIALLYGQLIMGWYLGQY